ncbi:hypothetical protein PHLGIDRAFT_421113 [Phlebiopsis gigantea 11061_1 CR5-6]|uniref:RRM domain-containing protein n=1 Tax=Phlebiopsis gigantea (strain 11061_1 CR5-6) TaxID=745531 RepID=A0A0C3RYY3_PHLG1|nr:hypothetical protein PHLGIDRAFT_421113 [Phlebiopsis gigantea 11061_1 CR5-6]
MADEIITKRIHVSGLTPSITPADLSQKLGSFGSVKALDGFGALDALGEPRKFGYVTLETTRPKLTRCMNLLSGVTWKGTKLRIGEAKPDFRERLAAERAAEGEPPRKKRRLPRGVQGVHSADMSIVTPENVSGRGGWKVTPLGRLVRPVRMRPAKPLPEQTPTTIHAKGKGKQIKDAKDAKDAGKVKKRRAKEPPSRARRQTINPLKYGSQQVKGVFLENAAANITLEKKAVPLARPPVEEQDSAESSSSEEEGGDEDASDTEENEIVEEPLARISPSPTVQQRPQSPPILPLQTSITKPRPLPADNTDITLEKNAALGLLQSLFGGRSDNEWGDKESLGSDVDMDELASRKAELLVADFEDDIEVVPMDENQAESTTEDDAEGLEAAQPQEQLPAPSTVSAPKSTRLKDLFAPREAEAGFSLLGHLDLDDELAEEPNAAFVPQAPTVISEQVHSVTAPSTISIQGRFTLDQSSPLFFPFSEDERSGFRGRIKDPLDIAKENGWDWRKFCRTQTSEEIKQKWEEQKVELTKDWKRRHREAIKSRRRRGGAGDGE